MSNIMRIVLSVGVAAVGLASVRYFGEHPIVVSIGLAGLVLTPLLWIGWLKPRGLTVSTMLTLGFGIDALLGRLTRSSNVALPTALFLFGTLVFFVQVVLKKRSASGTG